MEVKLNLTKEEHKDLVSYCNLNDLLISSVVKDSFTTGFNIERYGLLNAGPQVKEKIVEKEVVKYVEVPKIEEKEIIKIEYIEVEKIKEVPVEKIIEKEVIKEVPIEVMVEKEVLKEIPVETVIEKIVEVIKEVPVEKVVVQEVVKEVPVDKIVYITDQQELNEKIFQKDQEIHDLIRKFSTKETESENIFQKEKNELLRKINELENRPIEVREVVKEIPVEKIVIKEVPVETVIEKIVEVAKPSDDKLKLDALQQTVMKLRQENIDKEKKIQSYEQTIQDIQKMNEKSAVYLRGSNLDDKLYK